MIFHFENECHKGVTSITYETKFGLRICARTLSQMKYEISPLLVAQRNQTYKGIADAILAAGGLLTNIGGLMTDIGMANAEDTMKFYDKFEEYGQ